MFAVDGIEADECPVSLITQQSIELLDVYARSRRAYDAFGVSLFGPDLLEWPAWAVDLVALLDSERGRIEAAEEELERRDRAKTS
jgi:hypothetical protein